MSNAMRFPWSGDVSQWINPMTSWFTGNTGSLVSVNYASTNPKVEEKIIRDVAGYGRQLGKISAVLEILTELPEVKKQLNAKQQAVVEEFRDMAEAICKAKEEMLADALSSPFRFRGLLQDIQGLQDSNPELYAKLKAEIRDTLFQDGK